MITYKAGKHIKSNHRDWKMEIYFLCEHLPATRLELQCWTPRRAGAHALLIHRVLLVNSLFSTDVLVFQQGFFSSRFTYYFNRFLQFFE